ncbi:hypothetical protein DRE_01568 [Drechslerella stenobrocha 248]|uniref:Uncharacterized protein n=1 Tax=Drechslerella stenobrocha 248 TaxID=1043628 RepID=W7HIH2_9PEZI|nr:hypothetical protein DRE_01568 [Drechslerella stenobrocha 248]
MSVVLKLLFLSLLSLSFAIADTSILAHPRQSRVRKVGLIKRDSSGDDLFLGGPCVSITGNDEDIVCFLELDTIACAPTCCKDKKGTFVDGCPAGDKCVFEPEGLKCCPRGEADCGPRPTACANFGQTTTMGQVMCPSATPACATRVDGGIACTGSDPGPTIGRPKPYPVMTSAASTACTSAVAVNSSRSSMPPSAPPSVPIPAVTTSTLPTSEVESAGRNVSIIATRPPSTDLTRGGTMTISIEPATDTPAVPLPSIGTGSGMRTARGGTVSGLLVVAVAVIGVFV